MMIRQLSLFDPNYKPTPHGTHPSLNLIPVETCNAIRAAQLLQVHPTTLYRIRRQGLTSYQKARWIAQLQSDRKTWQVCYQLDQAA